MVQINCPKCNIVLSMPNKNIYEGSCPRCGTYFRIRDGKSYEGNEIADNILYTLTQLLANIAKADKENKEIYFSSFDAFIKNQTLTKSQFADINKVFNSEFGSFFHSNKKKEITSLKLAIDETYKSEALNKQQEFENNLFVLIYNFALLSKNINEDQQKLINTFTTIFEFSEERKQSLINSLTPKPKQEINHNIEGAFNKITSDLLTEYPTQEEFIKNLIVSFKRPFISGNSKTYRNLTTILSTEENLIEEILNKISLKMKEEILIFGENSYIDCAEFNDDIRYIDFLNALINQINSSNDIIILKNYKTLSPSSLKFMSELLSKGNALYNNNANTLYGNNKFFILLTSATQDEFVKLVDENLFNSINDLIKLEELSIEDITNLTRSALNKFIFKNREELQLNLFYSPDVIDYLVKIYNKNTGMKSIYAYIEHNIKKPIVEYKLKRQPNAEVQIIIALYETKLSLYSEGQYIPLEKLLPKAHNANLDEVKDKLNKIIGLDPVKEYVLKLEDNVTAQKMREESGLKNSAVSMNMIFTGNPGTGKTTIARIVAEYLKALGVISKGQLVEVSRNDLIGEYQGQTAQKTAEKINSALGGVLFIDEAYALCRSDGDSFGLEAIDTIVKMMEDNKNNLVVILAGYSNEMKEFLKNNSGLKSRFPNIIDFPDYTPQEMYKIAVELAKANDYIIDPQCIEPLINYFETKNVKGKNDSGNGRLARNTIENAIINQSKRIIRENDGDYQTLKLIDFEIKEKEEFNLEDNLVNIIGLDEVKNYIRSLAAKIRINKEREKLGIASSNVQTLHMIFKGNPGTGKTMMARTVADLLFNLNVISTNNLVETDRAGLVAGYIGQTAQKTTEKVYEALNGVLFIDEAYTLSQGGENDFGHEAIDTLVKLMDDNRDRLVVILAGYSSNMQQFLDVNPGLQSRFPNVVEFADYDLNQLMQIATNLFAKNGYELSNEATEKLSSILDQARIDPKFGNGRYVRNLFERATTNQAMRVSILPDLTKEILTTIAPEDIEKI